MKMCRRMSTFLFIVTTLWLFLIIQTTPSPLKDFIQPRDIESATGPFVDKYLYVDKTYCAYKLCQRDGGRYFFVRPRRFGKSTFLRTLQRIFDGSRHIFNGTYIHGSDYFWNSSYPVLYLDLGQVVIETVKSCEELMKTPGSLTLLEKEVNKVLMRFKTMNSLLQPKETRTQDEFGSILDEMKAKGELTVVLIDEYDFSILNNMQSCPPAAKTNSDLVRDILLHLKGKSGSIKFALVTGISKSVFATFGSTFDLEDITDNIDFHDITGLTDPDLNKHYGDHFTRVSSTVGKLKDTITSELKNWYNGFKFSLFAPAPLYNPSSVHSYLKKGVAKGYWADKGHAKFLYDQMVSRPEEFSCLNMADGVQSELEGSLCLNVTDPVLLLYDAGYLTIKSFSNGYYTLQFPNIEMETAYYTDIATVAKESGGLGVDIEKIRVALMNPIPNMRLFASAMNSGIKKYVMRGPFEEWFDWQIMIFMRDAGLKADRQCPIKIVPGPLNEYKQTKIVDVTGYSDNTFFLIEVKYDRSGCTEAWDDAKQSIQSHLDRNKKEEKPLNILAVGITFTGDRNKNPVVAYKAKLFGPNGKVLKKYFSSTRIKNDTESDEFFEESSAQQGTTN